MSTETGWEFLPVVIDGDDLVVRHVRGTRFGGTDDGQDNGAGASGFETAKHPEYLGVSLPQRGRCIKSMADCPLPKLPWFIPVKVYSEKTKKEAYGHLIDIGPSKPTKNALDMTNALVKALDLPLADGVYTVSYRVIGGAKYLPKQG